VIQPARIGLPGQLGRFSVVSVPGWYLAGTLRYETFDSRPKNSGRSGTGKYLTASGFQKTVIQLALTMR
jgi:hypothetical protein